MLILHKSKGMPDIPDTINNTEKLHFEIKLGNEHAYIEYRWHNEKIVLMHTEVPESMRGKGIANKLAKDVFEYIRSHKLKSVVYCPFLLGYLKRHPEYDDLVTK